MNAHFPFIRSELGGLKALKINDWNEETRLNEKAVEKKIPDIWFNKLRLADDFNMWVTV